MLTFGGSCLSDMPSSRPLTASTGAVARNKRVRPFFVSPGSTWVISAEPASGPSATSRPGGDGGSRFLDKQLAHDARLFWSRHMFGCLSSFKRKKKKKSAQTLSPCSHMWHLNYVSWSDTLHSVCVMHAHSQSDRPACLMFELNSERETNKTTICQGLFFPPPVHQLFSLWNFYSSQPLFFLWQEWEFLKILFVPYVSVKILI